MEGARFLALLLYFEGRVEGRGVIAPLKRDALHVNLMTKSGTCPLNLYPWNLSNLLQFITSIRWKVHESSAQIRAIVKLCNSDIDKTNILIS